MRKWKTLITGGRKYFFHSPDFHLMEKVRPIISKVIVDGTGMIADKPDFRHGIEDPNITYENVWGVSPDFIEHLDMFRVRGAGLYGLRWAIENEVPYAVYSPNISNGIDKGLRRNFKKLAKKSEALIVFPHGEEQEIKELVSTCVMAGVHVMWAQQLIDDVPIIDEMVWGELFQSDLAKEIGR